MTLALILSLTPFFALIAILRTGKKINFVGGMAGGDMVSPRNGILERQTSGKASKAAKGNRKPATDLLSLNPGILK